MFHTSSELTGDDSGRVVVWNMAPIVKEQAEEDDNIPKLLCQMDNHLGLIFNIVLSIVIFPRLIK